MQKYEYRCNRCMVIEQKWILNSSKPTESVPCGKCGGSAERIITYSNLEVNEYKDFADKKFT